jgi:CDP-diacylglycerol--glycerol-3-phosphate 3-phosphatidyltransferase
MFRHVPNAITGSRLLLAAVFFVLLGLYQHSGRGDPLLLNLAFAVYLVALVSDFLDGYLARKWQVEGAFGRVVDPFVDKVLVLGTFIFFAGKNFVIQKAVAPVPVVQTITGVAPWMVVLILARELLVTSLRGQGEATGVNFGAAWLGKVKMVLQSVTILVILLYVNYFEVRSGDVELYARWFRNACIWATIVFTLYSGFGYVRRGAILYQSRPLERSGEGRGLGTRR